MPADVGWWRFLPRLPGRCNPGRLQAFLYRALFWGGVMPSYLVRDIRKVHARLPTERRAVWLGSPLPSIVPPAVDGMPRAVARVRAVMAGGRPHPASVRRRRAVHEEPASALPAGL